MKIPTQTFLGVRSKGLIGKVSNCKRTGDDAVKLLLYVKKHPKVNSNNTSLKLAKANDMALLNELSKLFI